MELQRIPFLERESRVPNGWQRVRWCIAIEGERLLIERAWTMTGAEETYSGQEFMTLETFCAYERDAELIMLLRHALGERPEARQVAALLPRRRGT